MDRQAFLDLEEKMYLKEILHSSGLEETISLMRPHPFSGQGEKMSHSICSDQEETMSLTHHHPFSDQEEKMYHKTVYFDRDEIIFLRLSSIQCEQADEALDTICHGHT
jgi:hypothetical protein